MKNFLKTTTFLIGFMALGLLNETQAQCGFGQMLNTYCYAPAETNNVAFEFCPAAGEIAQSNILAGSVGNFLPDNSITIYEGTTGSGTTGAILFGPFTGDLTGTVVTATAPDLCLIFVINSSPVSLSCNDGFDEEIQVCSASLPATIVNFVAPPDLCINAGVQTGLSGGSPIGGVYAGPGVTDDGNGNTYSFDPSAAGVAVHILTYTVGANSGSDEVEVFGIPVVLFTAPADVCIDAGVQMNLGSASPVGGIYSGDGVTDNGDGTYDFNPAIAGLGVHTITYTESSICAATSTDDIEVLAACGCPVGETNYFYCGGGAVEIDFVAFEICPSVGMAAEVTIVNGTYIQPGNSLTVYEGSAGTGTAATVIFGPATGDLSGTIITGSGADDCLIFVTNSTSSGLGCQNGLETGLSVCGRDIAAGVNFAAPFDLCVDSGVQAGLGGGLPIGGVYSGPGVTDTGNGTSYDFDPATAGIGTHSLIYTVAGNSATDDVEVFAIPTVNITAPADICLDAGVLTHLGGATPFGGVYSGPGVTDGGDGFTYSFDPLAAGLGIHTITYTDGICSTTGMDNIEVLAACSCPMGETTYFNCYDNNETDVVIFEVCPNAGEFAQATITSGTYDFLDFLTVYRGVSGSGTGGTIVLGPTNGDLAGLSVSSTVANECLIFVSNSEVSVSCSDGNEDPLIVCGISNASNVTFTALPNLSVNAGVQTGISGGSPSGGVYSGPGVTDDGNGMTYTFDPAAAGVGVHTLTYTTGVGSASDDVEVLNLLPPSFSKSFNPTTIGSGSITTLTFTINNSGSGTPVSNLNFIDNLPAGMTVAANPNIIQNCFSGTITAVPGSNSISFSNGQLTGSASCQISVNVTSTASGVNTTGDLTSSAGNSGTASANLTVNTGCPIVTKSFMPATVNLGETSTMTFNINNTTGVNIILNSLIDNLPIGMTIANPANLTVSCPSLNINAAPGSSLVSVASTFQTTLTPGNSCSISVDVVANQTGDLNNVTENITFFNNVFQIQNCGSAAATLNVLQPSEIFIQKSFVTNTIAPGGTTDLEFTLTNLNRDFPATNISFTDNLTTVLAGLTAIGTPLTTCGGGTLSGTTVLNFTGGAIPANGSCTFSVPVQVPVGAASGTYVNVTGAVTADINGSTTTGNMATANLNVANVPTFTKTFLNDPVPAGGTTTVEFTITNTSTTDAITDLNFTDNIAAFISGATISALPSAGACGAGSTFFSSLVIGDLAFNMTGGNIAAGASCTFSLDLIIPLGQAAGTYTNTTSFLNGNIAGQAVTAPPASDDLQVLGVPQLTKSFLNDPVNAGDVVDLEFTISHDALSTGDATDISFMDDLNAVIPGLVAVGLPLNFCGGTISGTSNLTFTGGTLTPGEVCTFSVPVQIPSGVTPGSYTNTTSPLSATVGGQSATGNVATDNLDIGGLTLTKEFLDDPVIPGDLTTLRFTIDNTSTFDATSIFFTDNLGGLIPGMAVEAPLPTTPCGSASSASGTTFFIFFNGEVDAGSSCSFDVNVRVPASASNGTYTNVTSNLSATMDGVARVLPPATDDLIVSNNLIGLSKTFTDNPAAPGGTVTVEYTLTNLDATNTIDNIAFTDDFDGLLSGLAVTGLPLNFCGGTVSGTGLLNFSGGSLAAGASCTFSVTLQVPASAQNGASFTSPTSVVTGEITGLAVNGEPASDDLNIQGLSLTKSFSGPVSPGGSTTITFTVTNDDPTNTLIDIAFTDDLDAFINGAVATNLPIIDPCGAGSQVNGTSLISFGRGELGPRQSCSFDVVVNIPCGTAAGTYTNTTSSISSTTLIGSAATADLVVNAAPTISFVAPPDFCLNAGIQLGMGQSTTPTGGSFSGPGVTDDGNGTSFAFNPVTAGVGTHTLTYTLVTNGCTYSGTDDIEIFALPTVTFTAPADLCINAGVQAGLGGGTPPQGTMTGDMGVYSGPGVTDDGNGMTYSFNPATAGVGTHTLTYTYNDENGCANSASDDLQVFALPNVMFAAAADLCVDAGAQIGLGGGTPTGGVYSGPGVIDGGNGTSYLFNPITAGVGTHTITYTVGVAGCVESAMDDIQVFAIPNVDFIAPAGVCLNAGIQTGLGGGTPTGGFYVGNGVTDDGNGTTFTFDPSIGVAGHIVTYFYTDGNGCQEDFSDILNVFALPTVAFAALSDLCINSGVQSGLGSGTPSQGTVTGDMGIYSGPGVTDDGNGITYSFNPATAGVGTHTLTYTYTDENGCTNSASDDVQVFALPNVMFAAAADLCVDAGAQIGLGGGTPTGGVYSGPGVIDGGDGTSYLFNPVTAGVGTHTITYTVGVAGCVGSAMDDIQVFAIPNVDFIAPAGVCLNAGIQTGLGGGTPTGGFYAGNGVTDDGNGTTFTFDPSIGVAGHIITYFYMDGNGCQEDFSDILNVFALPTVAFVAPADLCINSGVQTGLGGGTPPQGTVTGDMGVYSGPGVTDDGNGMSYSFNPATAGVGTHTLTYTYTDENACTNSVSDDIQVFALPNVMFSALADLCIDSGIQNGLGGGTPAQGTVSGDMGIYSGPGVTDEGNGMTYSFNPATAGVGVHTLTYSYTDENGCSALASDMIEVFALPTVMFNSLADLCIDGGVQTGLGGGTPAQGTVAGDLGVYAGTGVTDDGNGITYSFNPVTAGVGTHTLTYTYTDENGCSATASNIIEVFALPTVIFTAPADLCIDAGVQTGLGAGTPAQGTASGDVGLYGGPGVTDDGNGMTYTFDPAAAGIGVHILTYGYTDENGCGTFDFDEINVFALPTASFTAPDLEVCVEDPTETGLGGGMPMGGVYSGTGVTDDGNGMTFSFDPTASAPAGGIVTVTYTFTDANGCAASASDGIFVDPICCELIVDCSNITDETLSCRADLPPVDFDLPIIVDSCGVITPSALTIIPGDSGCPNDTLFISRTYFIQDAEGNMDQCMQTFTVISEVLPTISCPANRTVACASDISVSATNATATSECGTPSVAVTGPIQVGADDCPMTTYTYTYTVTDHCGRTASCEQVFTIENLAPTITCPANMTVECLSEINPDPNDALVTTSCTLGSNVVVTGPVQNGDDDCPSTTYTYTYIVSDVCGRTASCEQVFTIANDPPTITCPADMTVECFADINVDPMDATVVTSCGLGFNTIITGPVQIGQSDCFGTTYTYTYTTTDDCGRVAASCDQIFTIQNAGPILTCPAPITVECAEDIEVDPSDVGVVVSCGSGFTAQVFGPNVYDGTPDCPGARYVYRYLVEDDCGRISICERDIFIDNAGPTISCPGTQIISCADEIILDLNEITSYTTSCGQEVDLTSTEPVLIGGLSNCSGAVYFVEYTVTDQCGRSASCSINWQIENEAPTVTCMPDRMVDCPFELRDEQELLEVNTACELGYRVEVNISEFQHNCPGAQAAIEYTIFDDCGRSVQCIQNWELISPPFRVIPPPTVRVACIDDYTPNIDDAEVESPCGLDVVKSEIFGPLYDEDEPLCAGSVINYLYSFYDECGRMICEAQAVIIDPTAISNWPEFEDTRVECDKVPDPETAVTICGQLINLRVTEEIITIPGRENYRIIRTYEGRDACGDLFTFRQIIVVICRGQDSSSGGRREGLTYNGLKMNGDLVLFPNPVISSLTVSLNFPDFEKVSTLIYSSFGEVIYRDSNSATEKKTIDVSGFGSGLYHLVVIGNDEVIRTEKFIIQR